MNRMTIVGGMAAVCALGALLGCSSNSDSNPGVPAAGSAGSATAGAGGSVGGGSSGAPSGGAEAAAGSAGVGGGSAGSSGGSAGSSAAAAGSAGSSAGAGGGSTAGQAFSPAATYKYVGAGPDAGISIVAGTMDAHGQIGPQWLVSMKGEGPDPVCIIIVSADFLDASNTKLAHANLILHAPMYTSFGSPTECIGKGDVGMGQTEVTFSSGDLSQVTQVNYGFDGNIDPAATKLNDVSADGIMIADFSATQKKVTGTLTNLSASATYKYPELLLYPVDGVGRPLAQGDAINGDNLTPSGTWGFTMYVNAPIDKYVMFPGYEKL